MKTQIVLSAAVAALVFAPALARAQVPQVPTGQTPQTKIESLQAQVKALQAQVKSLQAQLRVSSSFSASGGRVYQYQVPGVQSFQFPDEQVPKPKIVIPREFWNIPPCAITLLRR